MKSLKGGLVLKGLANGKPFPKGPSKAMIIAASSRHDQLDTTT